MREASQTGFYFIGAKMVKRRVDEKLNEGLDMSYKRY